ncbi:MAG TPA: sulfotransferase [Pseudomonadales bacterium]|jgi:hypothetical protein|nr:sulfotransferase family protein [Gammaproteobacteria bacterium]MDP6027947.1 sulfotransferase [Pseudomonadales bacterium]MDP7314664.1 sulfotransferase [Pseudomonadales bacterium]MDP7577575.1 sulfotransferase [Pseudomonadales bacterium]HJL62225.1 sulfotransferase [Pseudomonadales bacterium]|tara:strand:+ start:2864 stop:3508 length:645 start_codon:yes stop_codon:yes gene_type:complete
MPLKLIGAGFGRTGTLSMKLALEQIGLGPCHHMMEVFGKPDHIALWQAAADGESVDWEEVFEGYRSAVDWPVCYFWKELAELYPDAKLLLTRRDPQKWYDSASNTIFKGLASTGEENDRESLDSQRRMVNKLIVDNTFDGDLTDREAAIDVFNKHNQEVIDTIDPKRLLVFEASQGWEPLCEFLGVDIPDTAYPRTNTTEDFQKRFRQDAENKG